METDRQTDTGVNDAKRWVEVPRETGRIVLIMQWERLYLETGDLSTTGKGQKVEEKSPLSVRRGCKECTELPFWTLHNMSAYSS